MKLITIWNRLGKQPLRMIQDIDAMVFVGEEEYRITNIKYKHGMIVGFDAERTRSNKRNYGV